MSISTNLHGQTGRIQMSGRFDFVVHREFKQSYEDMLNNPLIHEIEVDMQHLDFLDSTALGMLILLRERALVVNKSIVIANPSDSVFKLLDVANFDKLFITKGWGVSS